MKRPEAPCQFCCAREVGCHSTCEPYKEYVKAQKEYRESISAQKAEENKLEGMEVMRYKK